MSLYHIYDRHISFHRAYVTFGAGVTGALMLSQAVYWASRTSDPDGWFYKTQQEWEEETGLTRYEQEGARKKLVAAGVMQEKKVGVPCRLFYRADIALIDSLVRDLPTSQYAEKPQTGLGKTSKQARGKPADIHTGITTETTTQILPDESSSETDRVEACRSIWKSYSSAYLHRYGTEPVRNAKVNGQINQLLKRLGAEASFVAAYYVGINDSFLIRSSHEFGMLLAKAEAYRTQWATNTQMTGTTARQIENTQSNLSAAEEAKRMMREGGLQNAFLRR